MHDDKRQFELFIDEEHSKFRSFLAAIEGRGMELKKEASGRFAVISETEQLATGAAIFEAMQVCRINIAVEPIHG